MSDPSKYNIGFDFSAHQSGNPSAVPPGTKLDVEFQNIQSAINTLVDAVKDIRRSDGKLKNELITSDAISALAAAGLQGPPGPQGPAGPQGPQGPQGPAGTGGSASDTVPTAFTFTDVTNAALSTVYTSNAITVAGIDGMTPISITGGEFSINGDSYTSSPDGVINGDVVTVRVTSSGSLSTATSAVLTIGGVIDTYTVTTTASAADTTAPTITSASAFTQAENGALSIALTANETVTWTKVGGADAALFTLSGSTLSLAAVEYETPTDADANNTYVVQVRATDTAGNFTNQTITVTVTDVAYIGLNPPIIAATPAGTSFYRACGDSITFADGSGAGGTSYARLFAATDTTNINFAVAASNGANLAGAISAQAALNTLIDANPGYATYNLSVLIGAGDVTDPGNSAYYPSNSAAFLAAYQAYLINFDPRWDITVITLLDRSGLTSYVPFRPWAELVRTGLLGFKGQTRADGSVYCHEVIDFSHDDVMGVPAHASENTALYYDGTHPTQTGQNYLERAFAPVMSARMPAVAAPTIASASISGTAQDGQTLTASHGTLSGHSFPLVTYQWKRNGSAISGATGSTYQCVTADIGATITVTATATNQVSSADATSSATATVIAVPAPTNSVAPVISGTATEGQLLSATNGTWTNSPTSYTYVWKRNGGAISGAINSTYTLVAGDVGANITCTVTAINGGGSASSTSNSLGPVAANSVTLLDSLTASANSAYSTRKLRTAYSGSAIKVRRSSDSTTQDIGFDGSGNLDTTALAAFVGANSAYVDTWYDQSGNALDLTQATTADQPRIVNAGTIDVINGQPAVYWHGAAGNNTSLNRATGMPATNLTACVLAGPCGLGANTGALISSGGTGLIMAVENGAARNFIGGFLTAEGAPTITSLSSQASYALVVKSGAYSGIRRAGMTRTQDSDTSYTGTGIMVGNFGTAGYMGAIPEVLIFASVLSETDTAIVDASHVAYWGTDRGYFQDQLIYPAMTSATAPSGHTITKSSEFNDSSFAAFVAFTLNQDGAERWASGAGAVGWIARTSPAHTLTRYAITACNSQSPNTWTFEGSNDGSTWTTLDTRTGETDWRTGEKRVYTIASGVRGSYTSHRLNMTAANSGLLAVSELELITA